MDKFIMENTCLKLNKNGKLILPLNIEHIKFDIGLSYSAPQSQKWLSKENNLIVFGFEPHPDSINSIKNGAIKRHFNHGEPLDIKYIDNNFFLIPCALGLKNSYVNLYSTKNDVGCSSIFEPNWFNINDIFSVPCFTLKSFFDLFPFEDYPLIEYIKIDAQGSDLNIIKSGEEYIKNNVSIVTLEAENTQYKNTSNSEIEINNYMESIGFEKIKTIKTCDPTFVNKKFKHLDIYYEQI